MGNLFKYIEGERTGEPKDTENDYGGNEAGYQSETKSFLLTTFLNKEKCVKGKDHHTCDKDRP